MIVIASVSEADGWLWHNLGFPLLYKTLGIKQDLSGDTTIAFDGILN
jgi:hypothetical protein